MWFHCHRDIECFLQLKNCPFYRICGPQDICICFKKEEATPKVSGQESSPSQCNSKEKAYLFFYVFIKCEKIITISLLH